MMKEVVFFSGSGRGASSIWRGYYVAHPVYKPNFLDYSFRTRVRTASLSFHQRLCLPGNTCKDILEVMEKLRLMSTFSSF